MGDAGDSLTRTLGDLPAKDKQPASARILDGWVIQADNRLVPGGTGGRLRWHVASTVVVAALQRTADAEGRALFLLKGGTLLQHRLGKVARATKDVDGLVRGDLEHFIDKLDEAFALPWGPLDLSWGQVEIIDTPIRVLKPYRFDVLLSLRGKTWARVQVEISADEGGAGTESEPVIPPALKAFGIPEPETLLGLAMRYQIAQKLHAASDPHDPPAALNNRARDIVDLILLQQLSESEGTPTLVEIREAAQSVFTARASDAKTLGLSERTWPPIMNAYPHWAGDYVAAARDAKVDLTLEGAVHQVNAWITQLEEDTDSRD